MSGRDVAIVGGGVIGLAIAWRLAREGAAPLVVDAGKPSASAASAGMLAPSFERGAGALGEALYAFSAQSLAAWRDFAPALEEESGARIDYRPFGILGVAFDETEARALAGAAEALRARGASVELLSGAEARALEPALSEYVLAALHAPADGQVDARRLLAALREAVVRRGGTFLAGEAAAIEPAGANLVVRLRDGGAVEAGAVVLAAGAAASAIDAGPARPPVFPVKGEALALAEPEGRVRRVIRAPGAYLCPKSDGRLVVGATEIPHDASLEPTAAGIDRLRAAAGRVAPMTAALSETERWAGARPGTPDGAPVLGPAPAGPPGLVYALGHYRNGVLLAPATAGILADWLLRRRAAPELAAFGAARFGV
ncbi:glycine oxidase [Amphiplicatus metriothermophilus]|nr:glycine oxidase [Amphiplicatus metriothermophilus]